MSNEHGVHDGFVVFERGWLSSNNILFVGRDCTALVDSGYCTHGAQTLALVGGALSGRPLDLLINTHLHSDHCGGNAALQAAWPAVLTMIPPGQAREVLDWDVDRLSYGPTGQRCPRFSFSSVLMPNTVQRLGDAEFEVHAAPGHDPHSIILFEPRRRVLISADALWNDGFGIVFPELEGASAFDEVAATLDLIERLAPQIIIPGHGSIFSTVPSALFRARSRLKRFVENPLKHATHAAKVLLKFKLLELQQVQHRALVEWTATASYFETVRARYFSDHPLDNWVNLLIRDLADSGALSMKDGLISNT